jgi:hypothetical protein
MLPTSHLCHTHAAAYRKAHRPYSRAEKMIHTHAKRCCTLIIAMFIAVP